VVNVVKRVVAGVGQRQHIARIYGVAAQDMGVRMTVAAAAFSLRRTMRLELCDLSAINSGRSPVDGRYSLRRAYRGRWSLNIISIALSRETRKKMA